MKARRRGRSTGLPGLVAGDLDSYDLPDFSTLGDGPLPPILLEVVERAANNYPRWEEQVVRTRHCSRPIRLRGKVEQMDKATGEVRLVYTTEGEPNDELLIACGDRRASRCKSCSSWYQGDAYQVMVSGLRGGKGVPESVVTHPMVFVTLTAPSFGAVHAHRVKGNRVLACRPRDKKKLCPHGVRVGCSVRHKAGDAHIGEPLCPECFDYEGQVIWNTLVPALWKRTWTYLPRELARVMGVSKRQLDSVVKPRMAKVAEYQKRGAIHLHAIIRLDAKPPEGDPEAMEPPPSEFGIEILEAAVRAARASASLECPELVLLGRPDSTIRWGTEIDIRPIRGGGPGELSHEAVAAYAAKYATKFSEGMGLPQRPIDDDADIDALDGLPHVRMLVRTAWELGWRGELGELKLREHAHGLGFGGHFLTKSRRYSTTMGALRQVRRQFVRKHRIGKDGLILDAWGRPEDESQVKVFGQWAYAGWGYHTAGEAYLASSAAARAREERLIAREEISSCAA